MLGDGSRGKKDWRSEGKKGRRREEGEAGKRGGRGEERRESTGG